MSTERVVLAIVISIGAFMAFMFMVTVIPWAFPFFIILCIVIGAMAGWESAGRNRDKDN